MVKLKEQFYSSAKKNQIVALDNASVVSADLSKWLSELLTSRWKPLITNLSSTSIVHANVHAIASKDQRLLLPMVPNSTGDNFVGKVIDPCQCGNIILNVYNNQHALAYTIDGSCCQLGLWCKFPCEPCQSIDFSIKGADGVDLGTQIKKKSPGCLVSSISDADNFSLTFPPGCTKEDKAVLMCAVLFLDFRHFEEKNAKKQGGSNIIVVNNGDNN